MTGAAGDPASDGPSRNGRGPVVLPAGKYSQSLERGLTILRCFGDGRSVLGIADIADALGMSRSTTHRYVITLVALGYLEQGPSRKYRLGLRATDLGMAAVGGSDLRAEARPFLEELRERTSSSASLAVLDGADVCWLDNAAGPSRSGDPVDPPVQTGSRMPAHSTAEGKLLIAFQPVTTQAALIAEMSLTRHGPNTITTRRRLLRELDAIRERGYAVADEEQASGVLSIAAPVRDLQGDVIAAIAVATQSSKIAAGPFVDVTTRDLLACAGRLSGRIGDRSEDQHRVRRTR